MAIIRVGKLQRRNEGFVVFNQAVSNDSIHDSCGFFKLLKFQIWLVLDKVSNPLIIDFLAPAGLKKSSGGKLNQNVSCREWIKNIRVIDNCEIVRVNDGKSYSYPTPRSSDKRTKSSRAFLQSLSDSSLYRMRSSKRIRRCRPRLVWGILLSSSSLTT